MDIIEKNIKKLINYNQNIKSYNCKHRLQNIVTGAIFNMLLIKIIDNKLLRTYYLDKEKLLREDVFSIEKRIELNYTDSEYRIDIFIQFPNKKECIIIEVLESNTHIKELKYSSSYQKERISEIDSLNDNCIGTFFIWIPMLYDKKYFNRIIDIIEERLLDLIRVSYQNDYIKSIIDDTFCKGMGETAILLYEKDNHLDNLITKLTIKKLYKQLKKITSLTITRKQLKKRINNINLKNKIKILEGKYFTSFGLEKIVSLFSEDDFECPDDILKCNIVRKALCLIVQEMKKVVEVMKRKNILIGYSDENAFFNYKKSEYKISFINKRRKFELLLLINNSKSRKNEFLKIFNSKELTYLAITNLLTYTRKENKKSDDISFL